MAEATKSLAAEIEAVVCSLTCVEQYLIEAEFDAAAAVREASRLLEAQAAEIAALQGRAFEDGARTVVLPPKWVVVPRHPTAAMLIAAGRSVGSCDIAHEAYAQALAAAPALPLQPEGERSDA